MSEDAPVNAGAVQWPSVDSAYVAVRRMQSKLHRWAGDDHSRRFGDLFNLVYPMVDQLEALGKLGTDLLAAWNVKEDLLDLLALARTGPERRQVADRLDRFYRRCAEAGLPELERRATTIEAWWPQILAFIHTGVTNAGSEGTNRVIKTVARDAYGFRNPHNQRLRTRCATTRRARGRLNPA